MRLLIAIPIYNEQKYVQPVLASIRKFHSEILVVDDGSTDQTKELLEADRDIQLIRHPRNLGYGASLIDAFSYADWHGYDWVITIDCDEQHEPRRIPDFIEQIRTDRWDLISGSRYLQPSSTDDLPPGDRRTINATITTMVNETLHLNLTDSFCGFKAHRVAAMRKLKLTETGYAFPLQLWPQVARAGFRITEIPVRLIYKDQTRSFGGVLDDAGRRLRHYLEVFNREMAVTANQPVEVAEPTASTSCCCS
jgi:glycosyltransferase involved in cell wall biosynthesis